MEINGMAHVILTVSDFAASLPFYQKLLPFLGMKPVIDSKRNVLLRRRTHRVGNHAERGEISRREIRRSAASDCIIYVFARALARTSMRRIKR